MTRRAPIGQFEEIIAIFRQSSFGDDGAGGRGRDLLTGRNRILPGWYLSGHFLGGNPPGVATLQRCHVETPVHPKRYGTRHAG